MRTTVAIDDELKAQEYAGLTRSPLLFERLEGVCRTRGGVGSPVWEEPNLTPRLRRAVAPNDGAG